MAAVKKRLDELVIDAGERLVRRGEVLAWCVGGDPAAPELIEAAAQLAGEVVADVAAAASQGDYLGARKLAALNQSPPAFGRHRALGELLSWGIPLDEKPAWLAFCEACELAER